MLGIRPPAFAQFLALLFTSGTFTHKLIAKPAASHLLYSHLTLMVEQAWALSDGQRAETVTRITQSIANLAFSQGWSIDDAEAQETATQVEKKAYTVAQVESRTTTGIRPHSDSLKAYTRQV